MKKEWVKGKKSNDLAWKETMHWPVVIIVKAKYLPFTQPDKRVK